MVDAARTEQPIFETLAWRMSRVGRGKKWPGGKLELFATKLSFIPATDESAALEIDLSSIRDVKGRMAVLALATSEEQYRFTFSQTDLTEQLPDGWSKGQRTAAVVGSLAVGGSGLGVLFGLRRAGKTRKAWEAQISRALSEHRTEAESGV